MKIVHFHLRKQPWLCTCGDRDGYVTLAEWLVHFKASMSKGSATWIEHTVWVIQHVLIETSGIFVYSACGPEARPCPDLTSSTDSGRGFAADGSDIRCNIPPLGTHVFLTFWKGKKKIKQTKEKNMGISKEENLYLFKVYLEKIASIFYFIIVIKKMV